MNNRQITVADLSNEQVELLKKAQTGTNILVDACIGSGKTTTIQVLCNEFNNKNILYLTYNRLLKIDAKSKIKGRNVFVQNYHGFAFCILLKIGIKAGISDSIQKFNQYKPNLPKYDMLVLDEYQDINQEIADMLIHIKQQNPNIQIIAVGDIKQKIYDTTNLNIFKFMDDYLEDYTLLHFTKCFRLSYNYSNYISRIWQKEIVGLNQKCIVQYMSVDEIIFFLSRQKPKDILCLGSRYGDMSNVLNILEKHYPQIFNKTTVYASISDEDRGLCTPTENTAIFTTYDSSKGMERPICVVFDYTEDYWNIRLNKPGVKYDIVRNIFCVAMSRGKEKIIFVKPKENKLLLNEKTISTPIKKAEEDVLTFDISDMFSFKYQEDIENCFKILNIKKINLRDNTIIHVKNNDELIDLSPCIGIYQEAIYFNHYDIDNEIRYVQTNHKDRPPLKIKDDLTLEDKILYLTAYETYQDRYVTQVKLPLVTTQQKEDICNRLNTIFNPNEVVQKNCGIIYTSSNEKECYINGRIDVLKNNIVYELKFVSELSHNHFLQCACYMYALNLEKGILWNTRNNEMYEITISDKEKFLKAVIKTITKGGIL